VRENTNEHAAFPLQETGDGHPACFDLVVLHPAPVKGLETKVSIVQLVAAGGGAGTAAPLGFPEFDATWKESHD
jgi:hypothetical protein